MWDATVVDTLEPSYVSKTSTAAGEAANIAELRKRQRYPNMPPGYEFVPLAFETLGTMGASTGDFIQDLCGKLRDASGEHRAGKYFLQRLSLCLIRGNATSIMGTLLLNDGYALESIAMFNLS